jgi:hypothetical protein
MPREVRREGETRRSGDVGVVDDRLVDGAFAPFRRHLRLHVCRFRSKRQFAPDLPATSHRLTIFHHGFRRRRAVRNDEYWAGNGLGSAPPFGDGSRRLLGLGLPVIDQGPYGKERYRKRDADQDCQQQFEAGCAFACLSRHDALQIDHVRSHCNG